MSAPGDILAPPLGAEELRRLCDVLYRRTGIAYGETRRYFVERRLAERMREAGVGSATAYLALLRRNEGEVERFINSFTVNETYFYREDHQFACLSRALLPALVGGRRPGDRVRIWSVPCASGEEPYSIALWLLENWPLVDAYNIEIVGSDIDTRMLDMARAGSYSARATARLPRRLLADYFGPSEGGERRIIADLRESVTFTRVNLVDAASVAAQGLFDVIFCRNVLIYFDDAARLTAAGHLHDALAPGGFLCLGHTESMTRISDRFATRRFDDTIVHQRRA